MRKNLKTWVAVCLAIMLFCACVSKSKLEDRVAKSIKEFEQTQGNTLEVTGLTLEDDGKGFRGVLTGRLNGQEAVYDVTVADAGSDYDVDWELRK